MLIQVLRKIESVLDRGIGSSWAKLLVEVIKDKNQDLVGSKLGFEGGQMPLQQRLPKFGFSSRVNNSFKEVNVKNIDGLEIVSLESLKEKDNSK